MGKAKRNREIRAAGEKRPQYRWTPGPNRARRRANGIGVRKPHRLRDNKIQAHWLPVLKAQRMMERNLEAASGQ